MHFELKIQISILVGFLIYFTNIFEHPSIKLFIKKQTGRLIGGVEKSD